MTTNGEWLDYLAKNAPDELAAWFDAEHVETPNATLHGYTAAQDGDSRDKLEADVRKIADAYNMDTQRHGTERFAHELYYSIIHLLNRQRAIDDSICDECSSDYYEMQEEHDHMLDGIAKLMRLKQPYTFDPDKPLENIETIGRYIDELTAERDKLQEQLRIGWECECRLQAERDELKAEHERIVQELVDVNTRQCERTNELTAERDNWKSCWEKCKAQSDAILAEREQYRKLFGMALDWAHEITMLESSIDEGMA